MSKTEIDKKIIESLISFKKEGSIEFESSICISDMSPRRMELPHYLSRRRDRVIWYAANIWREGAFHVW